MKRPLVGVTIERHSPTAQRVKDAGGFALGDNRHPGYKPLEHDISTRLFRAI